MIDTMILATIRERLRLSLWVVPGGFAIGAVVLALALLEADRGLSGDPDAPLVLYGGTAEGARSVLSAIAQSMLTFTGLVFTVTMLVLQLASSQLSPRVMRTFLRDRGSQLVLALFVATFVYTLVVLRGVRTDAEGQAGFVPGLSIWVAFLLMLASVAAFVWYIHHMAHAIRASTVLASIAAETRAAVEELYPERIGRGSEPETVQPQLDDDAARRVEARRPGILVAIDEDGLLDLAGRPGRVLEVVPRIGEFVRAGGTLFRARGEWQDEELEQLHEAVTLGDERTVEQDAAFGFRQLVDVAIRALSPGTNDPTTAVQALDHLHDLLGRLADRRFPSPVREAPGDAGSGRLVLPRPGWDDYVRLALEEIEHAGAAQPQVVRRIRHLIDDLLEDAVGDRAVALRLEQRRLDSLRGEAGRERVAAEVEAR